MTNAVMTRPRDVADAPVLEQWLVATPEVDGEASAAAEQPSPPMSPRLQLVRASLVVLFILTVTLLLQLTVIGSLHQSARQEQLFDSFRGQLATGTAPVGPRNGEGDELPLGTPVAYLEIPDIGVRQVVVEGTSPDALLAGPGHRRDTPLPGQQGATVILGRRAAYGAPFASIDRLEDGDKIIVTTGQGTYEYTVIGVRREGDAVPPPPQPDSSRLLLATAGGRSLLPDGVVRVDADLVGDATIGPPRLLTPSTLPSSEGFMGVDTSTIWELAFWIQMLIALTVGVAWAWHRWGRAQTWIVFLPPLLLVSFVASGQVALLLPNLL